MLAALPRQREDVDRVNGWEAGLRDGLGYIYDLLQFLAVLDRVGAIPSCDTTGKNAFYGAYIEVGESCSGHAQFPQSPEKVESLVGFLNYSVRIEERGQVAGDLDTQKLEALDHFHFVPIDVDSGMPSTTLPEVDDNLLHFVDIEGELWL